MKLHDDDDPAVEPIPVEKGPNGHLRPTDIEKEIGLTIDGLKRVILELGLPDIVEKEREASVNEPCIVFLTYGDGIRITHMREGGRISPHNVHYAFDPTWFTFDQESGRPVGEDPAADEACIAASGYRRVYLLKGISFDRHGHQATYWTYKKPRLVTYLAQGFTFHGSGQYRDDGIPLETHVDTPLCSSSTLEGIVSDKLYTRILLACNEVGFPATMAFSYKPVVKYNAPSELPVHVRLINNLDSAETTAIVTEGVHTWLDQNPDLLKVVVKPSGPSFQQSKGVSFHKAYAREEIVAAALDLVKQLQKGDAVLIDEFLSPMPARLVVNARESALLSALRDVKPARGRALMNVNDRLFLSKVPRAPLGHRIRVVVQRTLDNRCQVAAVICGVGKLSQPIGGHNTIPRTFDLFCDVWGIGEGEPRELVRKALHTESERTLQAIIDAEASMSDEERGGVGAQTDSIGLDVILSMRDGAIVPIVIEVNDYDSTSQAQELEFDLPRLHGSVVKTWLTTAVARSVRYMMRSRTVLAFTHEDLLATATIEAAATMGTKIIFVIPRKNSLTTDTRKMAAAVLVVPELSHRTPLESAKAVQAALDGSHIDGVVNLSSVYGGVARHLASLLCAPEVSSAVVANAGFQVALRKTSYPPMWNCPCPALFELSHALVKNAAEAAAAAERLALPIHLKPNVAVGGYGSRIAFTKEQAKAEAQELLSTLAGMNEACKAAFSDDVHMVSFEDASEHDVYVLVHEGQLVTGFILDLGPPNMPASGMTAAGLPTSLAADWEQIFISNVFFVLKQMRVGNGVYSVRVQIRAGLPNIVSLDSGAAFTFVSSWTKMVFGWSLAEAALALACGVRPAVPKERMVRQHIVGACLYESRHACVKGEAFRQVEELNDKDVLALWDCHRTYDVNTSLFPKHEEPKCIVACVGPDRDHARSALHTALDVLQVDRDAETETTIWFVNNM